MTLSLLFSAILRFYLILLQLTFRIKLFKLVRNYIFFIFAMNKKSRLTDGFSKFNIYKIKLLYNHRQQ